MTTLPATTTTADARTAGAVPTALASASRTGQLRRPPAPGEGRRQKLLDAVATHAVLVVVLAVFAGPLLFVLATSLMTDRQALTTRLWPHPFAWHNYADVFSAVPLARYFANTVLIAVSTTALTLLSSVPVAYALARRRFPGRQALFVVVIATMMLPSQVTIVPLYVVYAHLHWVGTPLPLIVPTAFGDAFTIFLLRQFFLTVPQDYLDAARIDGAGELRLLWSVFLPMVRPALAAAGLFSFFYAWNDYFNPLLYVGDSPSWQTLSIALAQFHTTQAVQWNLTMAATVAFVLPVVVLFFFAQRAFVRGVTLTGVKG